MNVQTGTALMAINLTLTRYVGADRKHIDHDQRDRDRPGIFAERTPRDRPKGTFTVPNRENLR